MANITNRNGKFLIRVFTGRDINGKQIVKSTTYVPPEGTSRKKAEKLAQEYAFEFERHCKSVALQCLSLCRVISSNSVPFVIRFKEWYTELRSR